MTQAAPARREALRTDFGGMDYTSAAKSKNVMAVAWFKLRAARFYAAISQTQAVECPKRIAVNLK
jgi:hypothetical protein